MRSALAFAAALALAAPAFAGSRDRCLPTFMDAQTLRLKGELHAAREKFRTCAKPTCPKLVRRDCVDGLGKIASAMPTIVLGARDHHDRDVVDVRVSLDGTLLISRLDGKPVEIDPGSHTLHFETDDGPPVDETVLVREGEKDRLVSAVVGPKPLPPPPPPPPPPPVSSGPSPWAWVVGGVGLATLAATVITGTLSLSQWQSLHDSCAPTHSCAPGDVSTVNTLYDVSYATGAIGGALVVTGVILFVVTRHHAGVAPTRGGATFTLHF